MKICSFFSLRYQAFYDIILNVTSRKHVSNKFGGWYFMNLLKNEPCVYKIQTSEQEVYETERYYLLKVVYCSGNLENELPKIGWNDGVEELLNVLFEAQQNRRFSKKVNELFNAEFFSVETRITEERRGTSIAVVKITKRKFREKVAEKLFLILKILFDRGEGNYHYYNF